MPFFIYSTWHLLLVQALITPRFKTHWICLSTELINASLVTIAPRMVKLFVFSERKNQHEHSNTRFLHALHSSVFTGLSLFALSYYHYFNPNLYS